MTKTLALALAFGLSMLACKAQVRVQSTTTTAAERSAEPAIEAKTGDAITLPDQIEFEFDEARIKQTPRTYASLQRLAEIMRTNPQITKLRIEGHTDDYGTPAHNEKLSKARADAVAKWLVLHDVAESRLVTVGHGARVPRVANDSDWHRAQNRRTEYYVEDAR